MHVSRPYVWAYSEDLWADAVNDGCESAHIDFNNLTLSLERDFYGDAYYTTCWLTLVPGGR